MSNYQIQTNSKLSLGKMSQEVHQGVTCSFGPKGKMQKETGFSASGSAHEARAAEKGHLC